MMTKAEAQMLLDRLLDEYGGEPDDWTGLRSLKRVGDVVDVIANSRVAAERDALLAKFEALAEKFDVVTHAYPDEVAVAIRAVIKEARA